jgi:hypothetical protein
MSRTERFKSKKDTAEEKQIVSILNKRLTPLFNVIHNETPNNHYDFDLYNNQGIRVSIIEFKRRYINSDTYPTWVIAKIKLERLVSIAQELNCKPIWIFGFNNEYRFVNVLKLSPDDLGQVTEIRRDKPRYGNRVGVSDVEDGYKVKDSPVWKKISIN